MTPQHYARLTMSTMIAIVMAVMAAPPARAEPGALHRFSCDGQMVQGGVLICQAPAGSTVLVSDTDGTIKREVPVNNDGFATIGLMHTEALTLNIRVRDHDFPAHTIQLIERHDSVRTITGFDCDKIDARTPEQKAHAAQSWQIKQRAFSIFAAGQGARNGFISPAAAKTISSPFGATRKYVSLGKDGQPCEKTSVHYGYDFAVPSGTPVRAPAAGIVTLSETDLYYEGGTIFLDHGDGLVSVFMHMAQVNVKTDQSVEQGALIGLSGNTGRTSGPHLHWGVKWRNPGDDNRNQDFYIDPALLLKLPATIRPATDKTVKPSKPPDHANKTAHLPRHDQ